MDNQLTLQEIEVIEKQNNQKFKQLIIQNLNTPEFYKTRRAIYLTVLSLPAAYWYFRWFKPGHPVKWPFMIGAGLGGCLHSFVCLSRDIYTICESETTLGNKFRKVYQNISEHNMYLPYFKEATLRSYKSKASSSAPLEK